MKPGVNVAFIEGGVIQFGVVVAILRRETIAKETIDVVITSIGPDGTANSDKTIPEDDVVELRSWRKDEDIFRLASSTPQYKWAEKRSEQLLNPPLPDSIPANIEVTVGADIEKGEMVKVEDGVATPAKTEDF